ncbi:unnamed protein product [Ectocarpus sp. 13 AM-2016]
MIEPDGVFCAPGRCKYDRKATCRCSANARVKAGLEDARRMERKSRRQREELPGDWGADKGQGTRGGQEQAKRGGDVPFSHKHPTRAETVSKRMVSAVC